MLAGEKVWNIRCDIHVLDQSGNMLDAINLAAVTALLHFRRPDVTVVGDSVTVHSVEDRQPVALALHHIPISCSFAFFDAAATSAGAAAASSAPAQPLMVVDPSLKEELCADSGLTVTLNVHGEICCLQKSGGIGIDLAQLLLATQVAQAKTLDLTALVQSRLKEDAALANTGNAVRGSLPTKPIFHAPAKPIDAFGTNVTRAPGTHQTAGVPIEVNMDAGALSGKDRRRDDSDDGSDNDEEDDDQEEEDEEDAEDEDDNDASMQDQAEFAAVAQKLQSKGTAAPTPASTAATKAKKK